MTIEHKYICLTIFYKNRCLKTFFNVQRNISFEKCFVLILNFILSCHYV